MRTQHQHGWADVTDREEDLHGSDALQDGVRSGDGADGGVALEKLQALLRVDASCIVSAQPIDCAAPPGVARDMKEFERRANSYGKRSTARYLPPMLARIDRAEHWVLAESLGDGLRHDNRLRGTTHKAATALRA